MQATGGMPWGTVPIATSPEYFRHPARLGFQETGKRVIDVAVALLVLVLAAPLIALIAVAIRLDSPGPCFFIQLRTGRAGRRFWMYKFRTMVAEAEKQKSALVERSHLRAPNFKVRHDPRVTRVGAVLRAWSLDEIPNLFNVLRGDMSLVGPRPTSWAPEHYDPAHFPLLLVRPGVTGLWQVSGRADLSWEERIELDLEYVRRRSVVFDAAILLRTIPAVLLRRGAY